MNEVTTWVRRSFCVAVWLVAAGLHGCGGSDAGQDAPAPNDFRHAYVLTSEYQQPVPDTQGTQSGNKPAGAGISMLSKSVVGSSPNLSSGWTPQQFQQAYNVPLTQQNNKPSGYGIKVAIITAYHYSNLQSDLNTWASHFNIKPITLTIVNQAGNVMNSNWAMATNIAVQMLNTVSPGATVHVIEAKSTSQADMKVAMQTAVKLGVNIVSMPFGVDEAYAELQVQLFSGNGVAWIASSGDDVIPTFPATSPDVIAVGGTTLSSVNPLVETAWVDAGAGMSIYEKMPSFQMIPSVQKPNTTAYRSVPDVAFNADPKYGAHIYTSILGGWYVVGGTSVSTGFFTGVAALVNASRKSIGRQLISSNSNSNLSFQRSLYQLVPPTAGSTYSTVLNDVVDGHAGSGSYRAGPGYDIATGLGSLNVKNFISHMNSIE